MISILKKHCILCIISLALGACAPTESEKSSGLLVFNIEGNYNSKDILLTDIADIEYIPLLSMDSFYYNRILDHSKNYIITLTNNNGDITFFNKKGEPPHIINKRGSGPDEYDRVLIAKYDEDNDDLYVTTYKKKINVYDKYGNLKQAYDLKNKEYTIDLASLSENYLICYQDNPDGNEFYIVHKTTGDIEDIHIPYEKKIELTVTTEQSPNFISKRMIPKNSIFPKGDNIQLTDYSSDTVYVMNKNKEMTPVFARHPKVSEQEIPKVVHGFLDTDKRTYFVVQDKAFDVKSMTGFKETSFMYDKKKKEFVKLNITFPDIAFDESGNIHLNPKIINYKEIATNKYCGFGIRFLPGNILAEKYEKGEINGKLKEVYENLNDPEDGIAMMIYLKNE